MNIGMRLRLFLLAGYFIVTPIFIISLIFYQSLLRSQNNNVSANFPSADSIMVSYAPIEPPPQDVIAAVDPRIGILTKFLGKYNSPLTEYTKDIIDKADKYGLDWRLIPAIAMQESTLCLKAPKDTNNCWGFGIYGKKRTSFDNLSQAIEVVSKTLASEYQGKGLIEPAQIMTKYTPSNTGAWAENVSYVMNRIASSL